MYRSHRLSTAEEDMHRKASPCDINRVSHINSGMGSLSFVTCAGMLNDLADERGMVKGHLWLLWDTNGAARLVMGPPPERGAASEQFSFGAQMAGATLSHHFHLWLCMQGALICYHKL